MTISSFDKVIVRAVKMLAAALVVAGALAGCNTTGCLDNQSALPLAAMYSSATGAQISVPGLEITGVGVPGDSVLVRPDSPVSEVYLPMRSTQNSTSWRLRYTQQGLEGLDDIITFDYDSEPYFASEECGAMYFYRIRRCSTTYNLIDSVVVADSLITNVDLVRIKIYFRTQTSETTDE